MVLLNSSGIRTDLLDCTVDRNPSGLLTQMTLRRRRGSP
jgi:hypothetical protein